jgi:hypothetical protein
MATTLRAELPALTGKKPARAGLAGEADRKFLSLGRIVERAIAISGLTKDQAAREMGYANASVISRWFSGDEQPSLSRLWAVPSLHVGLVIALAEAAGVGVRVRTQIEIEATA